MKEKRAAQQTTINSMNRTESSFKLRLLLQAVVYVNSIHVHRGDPLDDVNAARFDASPIARVTGGGYRVVRNHHVPDTQNPIPGILQCFYIANFVLIAMFPCNMYHQDATVGIRSCCCLLGHVKASLDGDILVSVWGAVSQGVYASFSVGSGQSRGMHRF